MLLVTTDIKERTINIQALSEEARDGIAACAQKIAGLRTLVMEVRMLVAAIGNLKSALLAYAFPTSSQSRTYKIWH